MPMSRIDDAVSRILDRQVRARALRAPVHRPPQHRHDRQQGAPQGRPPGGGRVAGAAQEPAGHPAAEPGQEAAGVRRRQQRRQHRQPGRRLDADLAGRLDQRDPRPDRPRRRAGDLGLAGAVQRDGERPGAGQRGRRRGGRRDAVRRGVRRRQRPAVGLRPGRQQRAAAEEDDAAQRRRPAGDPPGLLAGRVLHRPGRLRAADDHPAGAARRRSTRWSRRGCPAARGWAWPTCCSASRAFTGKLPVTWPRSVDQEPINVGDADYDPLYRFGFGLRT